MKRQIDWVRVSEAAKMLDCSVDSIRKWSDEGKLIMRRTPGNHRLISMRSIEDVLNRGMYAQN